MGKLCFCVRNFIIIEINLKLVKSLELHLYVKTGLEFGKPGRGEEERVWL